MSTAITAATALEEEAEALRNYQAYSKATNAQLYEEARRGDKHTLDVTVHSHISVVKYWNASNRKQDTLGRYMLNARARGALSRPLATIEADDDSNSGSDRLDVVLCSDGGKFWTDLPLLGQDLTDEWVTRYYRVDYYDNDGLRSNLAFIGRLISVGIYRGPAACVLSLFRETLETPRPLLSSAAASTASGTDVKTESAVLPVRSLIHALQQMLRYADGGIIALGNDSFGIADAMSPPHMSNLGQLAIQAGLSSPGFSPSRWRFWIQRLEELAACGFDGVADIAGMCLSNMRSSSEAVYGPLAGKPEWLTEPSPATTTGVEA